MNNIYEEIYLGDGVYVKCDGYHVWLMTKNGYETTNRIALEPQVLSALDQYLDRLKKGFETLNLKKE